MKRKLAAFCFGLALLCGCASTVTSYNPVTGRYETTRVSGVWGIFTNLVDKDVEKEASGAVLSVSWERHWVEWCEDLYYGVPEGERSIRYTVERRRAAGLPGIPTIEKRQFRSRWKIFTDNVDFQIDREVHGLLPIDRWWKNWTEYWQAAIERASRDPFISDQGVEYILKKRADAGLSPIRPIHATGRRKANE